MHTFLKLKSNIELTETFQQAISRQYNAVSSVIENNHADVKKVRLIGSVGRKTRIQPRPGDDFDIDMLIVLGEFDRWMPAGTGITKEKAMDSVLTAVTRAQRYSKKNPDIDNPTVTFAYENNVKVELVPAYLDNIGQSSSGVAHSPKGRAYWVPARTGWQLADYDYEASYITDTNNACNGMLIPTVKMLKVAKREHFPSMKSYHLEVIATHLIPERLAVFKANNISPTYPGLVADTLYLLRDQMDKAWGIPGSLSPTFQIDSAAKTEFTAKADWLRRQVWTACRAGTDAEKHQAWKLIFKDWIPLS